MIILCTPWPTIFPCQSMLIDVQVYHMHPIFHVQSKGFKYNFYDFYKVICLLIFCSIVVFIFLTLLLRISLITHIVYLLWDIPYK
jgi:hypothetical protein